jgi:hypothetical protein
MFPTMFPMTNIFRSSTSTSNMMEKEIHNGKIVRDVEVQSYNKRDPQHNDFLVKGQINRKPFYITNMVNNGPRHISFRRPIRQTYKIKHSRGKRCKKTDLSKRMYNRTRTMKRRNRRR